MGCPSCWVKVTNHVITTWDRSTSITKHWKLSASTRVWVKPGVGPKQTLLLVSVCIMRRRPCPYDEVRRISSDRRRYGSGP